MSSHLTGSHRRSGADNGSRERHHSRTKDTNPSAAGNNQADYNNTATSGGHGGSRSRGHQSSENQVKEAIIDLYLKVKIRSKDEIDLIEPQELTDERSRLRNLSSLNILGYLKTKFEDLMQIRLEEEKDAPTGRDRHHGPGRFDVNNGAASEFTSTFHSLDLPPEEYETQLQDYEAEVRNHIKVEQQLKLHIEVLQEKIDDLEKEKKEWDAKAEARSLKEKAAVEKKLKHSFQKLME